MSFAGPQTQRTRTTRPKMIGAHVATKKVPDHFGKLKRDIKVGLTHFWRKRGGQPQEFHGGFSR